MLIHRLLLTFVVSLSVGCEDASHVDTASTSADVVSSPGCSIGASPTIGWSDQSIDVNGVERTYKLYVPDGYDESSAYRVVFSWHGFGASAEQMALSLPLATVAASDIILVVPQGLPLGGTLPGWSWAPDGRDVDFFDVLLESVGSNLCVDENRVFSTGMSNGAILSNVLGCVRGDLLRAIAPIAGGLLLSRHRCQEPVAAMIIHGEADHLVPTSVGRGAYRKWGKINECGSRPWQDEPSPQAECTMRKNCSANAPVLWCPHGGGHVIPAFATDAVWNFFASF